jgi:hypothetical protein
LPFNTRNILSSLVVLSADPLGIDPKRQVDHEQAEESSKKMANFSLLAGTSCPAQGRSVVGHIEQNRIGMIGYQFCRDEMECGAIVYNDSNKLKDINQDEESILVVLFNVGGCAA